MNSKITALFAVAVMVTAGFVLVADTAGTDAKVVDNDFNAITIHAGTSHNVTLYTDEYQYKNYGYELKWYIAKNPEAFNKQADLDDKVTFTQLLGSRDYNSDADHPYVAVNGVEIDDVTFKITERKYTNGSLNNVGEYNLNISAKEGAITSPGYVAIKCDVSVKLPNNGGSYKVESLYYLYQITVQEKPTCTLDEMKFTKGINKSILISDVDSDLNVLDYYWYATGLPAGLSMDLSGNVSGTPHETAQTADSVIVVGTSKTDSTKTVDATLKVIIEEGSTNGIVVRLSGDVQAIIDAKEYVTESGTKDVTLTVKSSGPYDVLTVRIVDKDGNTHIIDGSQDNLTTFNIASADKPISGTGIYRIYVTAVVDSEKQTEYVDLYVLGNLDSVFAEIIVSGA